MYLGTDVIFVPPQYIHETSREGNFEKSLLFQPSRDRGPTIKGVSYYLKVLPNRSSLRYNNSFPALTCILAQNKNLIHTNLVNTHSWKNHSSMVAKIWYFLNLQKQYCLNIWGVGGAFQRIFRIWRISPRTHPASRWICWNQKKKSNWHRFLHTATK